MGKGIDVNANLPIIERLAAIGTDAERAAWLRQCPDIVVMQNFDGIRSAIVASGFSDGLAFLWARLAKLQAVRLPDGRHPIHIEHMLSLADSRMGHCR